MVAALVAWSLIVAVPAYAATEIPVRASKRYESVPGANANFLAWTGRSSVFAVPLAGRRKFRVNPKGTHALGGGIDATVDVLAYSQSRSFNSDSDIKFFDLNAKTRSNPRRGVNTPRDELYPTISGNELLFTRIARATFHVILYVGTTRRVLTTSVKGRAFSGQVNGDTAVYERCSNVNVETCTVYVYDIAAKTTTKLRNPTDRFQYAPSVSADGTVYFFRSSGGCGGGRARLIRHPVAGPEAVIATLPHRYDTFGTSFAFDDGGTNVVYYDRLNCKRFGDSDIYKVLDT